MEEDDAALRAHYELGMERERLSDGRGDLEFTRTTEIVLRRLPAVPALVADIGGGPGRYALWLASLGYQVEHRDLMPLHVEQLAAEVAGMAGIHTAVGDVRDLDLPNPGSGLEVLGLRSGAWVLIYNDTERGRNSLAVSLSEDEGKNWHWTRHLELDRHRGRGRPRPASHRLRRSLR
jgi:SAM-dependent methyltransferase